MGILEDIFFPKPRKPKTTAKGRKMAAKNRAAYKRTGKHFWYAMTSERDFPVGRMTKTAARTKAKRTAKRQKLGAIRRLYHLDS